MRIIYLVKYTGLSLLLPSTKCTSERCSHFLFFISKTSQLEFVRAPREISRHRHRRHPQQAGFGSHCAERFCGLAIGSSRGRTGRGYGIFGIARKGHSTSYTLHTYPLRVLLVLWSTRLFHSLVNVKNKNKTYFQPPQTTVKSGLSKNMHPGTFSTECILWSKLPSNYQGIRGSWTDPRVGSPGVQNGLGLGVRVRKCPKSHGSGRAMRFSKIFVSCTGWY